MTDCSVTKQKRLRSRVLRPHSADCYAIKNARQRTWPTPWAYVLEHADYRDSLGRARKNGGRRWIRIGCNCTGCPALIVVDELSLLEMLPHE